MKKILYTMMGVGMLFAATSCEDFLDTSSPSEADVDFVFSEASTARAALYNAYEKWRGNAGVHSNGVFYDLVVCGSDAERHPEAYASQIARHVPENLYGYSDATFTKKGPSNYTISQYGNAKGTWESLYAIIATTNTLISAVEGSSAFAGFATQDGPSELSQIYGEAVALRATCYHELIRFYGDIPHQLQAGEEASEITPRDVIAEYHINKLKEVEPLMFRAGESSGIDKTFMTRTYVQGLIARMALMEGGYQTRRSDFGNDYYKDLDGNVLSFEKAGETSATQCFYGRRTDWEKFYKIAETYLTSAVNNSGTTALQVNDPRSSDKKTFGNPYQYVFQQMMDETIADENVYEIPETRGKQGDVPKIYYGFGADLQLGDFSVGALFAGNAKADRCLGGNAMYPFNDGSGITNLFANITDRWSADNPTNQDVFYPRLHHGNNANQNNMKTSTWWQKDVSFLRLKQLTIAYQLPKKLINQTFLKSARIYVMGTNLLTFSKFKLWDPELNTNNGTAYPNVRTYSVGVNVSF